MGLLDRAKRFLSVGSWNDDDAESEGEASPARASTAPNEDAATPRAGGARRGGRKRPQFAEVQQSQSKGVDDALAARAAGDNALARQILDEIDRGGGLRTVLRAAAALEAGDAAALGSLLPAIAREEPRWRLLLQAAAALGDPTAAAPYLARAEKEGAPAWALAWCRATSSDEAAQREGLVELLFTDAPLARTVAARDAGVAGAVAEVNAAQRYASFAHGRDSIRRFGAPVVAELLDRAAAVGGP
jgi:hypothetical protein